MENESSKIFSVAEVVEDYIDGSQDPSILKIPELEYLNLVCTQCQIADGMINVGLFLEELEKSGIRYTDARLSNMMEQLDLVNINPPTTPQSDMKLDLQRFQSICNESSSILDRVFQQTLIIPKFIEFCEDISDIYEKCKINFGGKCSDYVPTLAKAKEDNWGVSICTVDGQRFSAGHCDTNFTLQSLVNPILYAECLKQLGPDLVHKYQGKEPSGRRSNEIALDYDNKPYNPLVNSGAISSTALLLNQEKHKDKSSEAMSTTYELIYGCIKRLAGNEYVGFNNTSFLEEIRMSDRNFALAHFMKENKCFPDDANVKRIMDLYCQFQSIEINCESGGVIAGAIANGGICPITGEKVLSNDVVQKVVTLMYGCGMQYNSGQFAFDVGLPSKSSISGGILVIVPNVMGMCLWSPPIDEVGNSVRGTAFCVELDKKYLFHRFDQTLNLEDDKKTDPTLSKYENPGSTIIKMLLAAKEGDVQFLKRLWFQEIDLNQSDYDGRTPLHLAACEGKYECVDFLINLVDVNPSPIDRRGHTPLEDALFHKKNALHGNFDNENLTKVIEILRKHGENRKNNEANLAPSISVTKDCDDKKYEDAETKRTQEELSIGTSPPSKNCSASPRRGGSLAFYLS